MYRTLKLYIKLKSFNLPHLDAVFALLEKKKRLGIYRLTIYSWTLGKLKLYSREYKLDLFKRFITLFEADMG